MVISAEHPLLKLRVPGAARPPASGRASHLILESNSEVMRMKRVLLVVSLLGLVFLAGGPPPQKDEQAGSSSDYVGVETCQGCHADRYQSYLKSPMGNKANPDTPAAKHQCETCHGPGSAHAEAGGGKGVGGLTTFGPKAATPIEKQNAVCLTCHAKGNRALWKGGMHQSRGLACANCHSMHKNNPGSLVLPTQLEVCSQCHKQIQAQVQRQSHHPIREGKLKCTDCHNPHGTVTEKLLAANTVNEKCYKCHAEKRGPFLWEHGPVGESCLNCHTPHGSSHDKLLVDKRPYLCQRCHSNSRHPGTLYALDASKTNQNVYSNLSSRIYNRACSNCHAQIHGSNHPSGKFFMR